MEFTGETEEKEHTMLQKVSHRAARRAAVVMGLVLALLTAFTPLAVSAAAPAPAEASGAPEAQSGWVYVVQRGDTLSSIARRFGVSVSALMRANNIANPNRIYVGQRLFIPSGDGGQPSPDHGCAFRYTVQRGETLTQIARRYGVSVQQLVAANSLRNPSRIYVGQRLCIPAGGSHDPGPSQCGQWHTVQRGDTLSSIARRCGVSVHSLINLNGIHNPNKIFVGQRLRIF